MSMNAYICRIDNIFDRNDQLEDAYEKIDDGGLPNLEVVCEWNRFWAILSLMSSSGVTTAEDTPTLLDKGTLDTIYDLSCSADKQVLWGEEKAASTRQQLKSALQTTDFATQQLFFYWTA